MNAQRPIRRHLSLVLLFALANGVCHAQLKAPRDAQAGTSIKPSAAASPAPTAPTPSAETRNATTDPAVADKEAAGQLAAGGWLSLLDRQDWGRAWEGASAVFRASVPLPAWMDGIPKVRQPLGPLLERVPVDAVHKTALAGRPDGNYVTAVFASKFANKADAQELVTTVLDADGKWRVTGYQVR